MNRALDSLFTALKTYGTTFPLEFWDTVCQELLFPIFAILKNKNDLSRFNSQGDMSVWLQSTMFQALRSLIDLYSFHFTILEKLLDGLLDLLCVCICQGKSHPMFVFRCAVIHTRNRDQGSLSNWYFMSSTTVGVQRHKVEPGAMGSSDCYVCEPFPIHNSPPTFRRELEGRKRIEPCIIRVGKQNCRWVSVCKTVKLKIK